jgi:hypothetical protein
MQQPASTATGDDKTAEGAVATSVPYSTKSDLLAVMIQKLMGSQQSLYRNCSKGVKKTGQDLQKRRASTWISQTVPS